MPDRPEFAHPAFDYENRIVTVRTPFATVASVYVPNGGKDFPAKMQFLAALDEFAAEAQREALPLLICGDLNVARTDIDVHPKERKPRATGQLPEERALLEQIISHGLVDVGRALDPDNDQPLHVVGAVARDAPAQHRLAPRLRPRQRGALQNGANLRRPARVRHERPRAGGGDVRDR